MIALLEKDKNLDSRTIFHGLSNRIPYFEIKTFSDADLVESLVNILLTCLVVILGICLFIFYYHRKIFSFILYSIFMFTHEENFYIYIINTKNIFIFI